MDLKSQTKTVSWKALEFKYYEKSLLWYSVFFLIGLGFVGYTIYSRNIFTSVTFAIMFIGLLVHAVHKPEMVMHELSERGVQVKDAIIPYKNIKKFWIIYDSEVKTLNLETTTYINSHIVLELGTQNPIEVKEYLKQYIPEELDPEESFADLIARKIRF